MDVSISHDPFAPEGGNKVNDDPTLQDFNERRWIDAGATEEEIGALSVAFDISTPEEKAGMNQWMRSQVNEVLLEWLRAQEETPEFVEAEEKIAAAAEAQTKVDEATAEIEAAADGSKEQKNAKARLRRWQGKLDKLTEEATDAALDLNAGQPDDDESALEGAESDGTGDSGTDDEG